MNGSSKQGKNAKLLASLQELTAEEKANPLAKYYYRTLVSPAPEVMKGFQLGKPMKPSKALMPDQMNELLKPGYLEVENGFCLLPSGVAYAATCTKMLGVTPEMSAWWNMWKKDKGSEDFLYKIWRPGQHFKHTNSDLAPGIMTWIVEDLGFGPLEIYACSSPPEELGFDKDLLKKSGYIVRHLNFMFKPLGAGPEVRPVPSLLIHVFRMTNEGLELRSRVWFGYQLYGGKAILDLNGNKLTEEHAYHVGMHLAVEMANQAELIKLAYKEYYKK